MSSTSSAPITPPMHLRRTGGIPRFVLESRFFQEAKAAIESEKHTLIILASRPGYGGNALVNAAVAYHDDRHRKNHYDEVKRGTKKQVTFPCTMIIADEWQDESKREPAQVAQCEYVWYMRKDKLDVKTQSVLTEEEEKDEAKDNMYQFVRRIRQCMAIASKTTYVTLHSLSPIHEQLLREHFRKHSIASFVLRSIVPEDSSFTMNQRDSRELQDTQELQALAIRDIAVSDSHRFIGIGDDDGTSPRDDNKDKTKRPCPVLSKLVLTLRH